MQAAGVGMGDILLSEPGWGLCPGDDHVGDVRFPSELGEPHGVHQLGEGDGLSRRGQGTAATGGDTGGHWFQAEHQFLSAVSCSVFVDGSGGYL